PLALRRVLVSGTYGSTAFAELLTPRGIVERRLLKTLRHIPQRLLGPRVWTPIGKALRSVLPARSSLALLIGLGVMVSASAGAAFWLRRAGWGRARPRRHPPRRAICGRARFRPAEDGPWGGPSRGGFGEGAV